MTTLQKRDDTVNPRNESHEMPIEVNEARRLDEIATATIQTAREKGVRSVTIRAVAARLGGSTAMITNYLPSRSALMLNALRKAEEDWARDMAAALDGLTGMERLRAAARWMCSTEKDDEVLRRLFLEIAGSSTGDDPALDEARSTASRRTREELTALAAEAGLPDPDTAAELLHLAFRGYWLATLEEPDHWSADQGTRTALALIDLLGRARPAKESPPRG